jgi:hypothetical protein
MTQNDAVIAVFTEHQGAEAGIKKRPVSMFKNLTLGGANCWRPSVMMRSRFPPYCSVNSGASGRADDHGPRPRLCPRPTQ